MAGLGNVEETERGFEIVRFQDHYDAGCSLQASSLAIYRKPGRRKDEMMTIKWNSYTAGGERLKTTGVYSLYVRGDLYAVIQSDYTKNPHGEDTILLETVCRQEAEARYEEEAHRPCPACGRFLRPIDRGCTHCEKEARQDAILTPEGREIAGRLATYASCVTYTVHSGDGASVRQHLKSLREAVALIEGSLK